MIYKKYKIERKFSPFVECLFSWEGYTEDLLIIETPPSSFCSIVFNYGASYFISNCKYPELHLPDSFLAGQAIRNYVLNIQGKIGMVGIVFKPTGLFHFLGISMFNFTEERIDLKSILPSSVAFEKEILGNNSIQEKIEILRAFLDYLETHGKFSNPQITSVCNLMVNKKGDVNITSILPNVYMSRRQFERIFLEHVGVSPKAYCKIRRFSYLCSLIAGKRKVNLTDIVYRSGYYDQSHFIKDFKYFAGRTPKFYIENNKELAHLIQKHEIVTD